MARYRYEPRQKGCIYVTNPWHEWMAHIDCNSGGAQQVFDDLCRDFERAGWELEKRTFDRRYMRRDWVRWEIAIGEVREPKAANLDERGFMAMIVEHYKERESAAHKQGGDANGKDAVQSQAPDQNREGA